MKECKPVQSMGDGKSKDRSKDYNYHALECFSLSILCP